MPPAANAEQHVAGVDILVSGTALDPKWRNSMIEMKVVDSLTLPDMALVRLKDPTGDAIDSHPLQLGKDLEIKASGKGERATTSIFKGQIAAVEPEFGAQGVVISIRAYDKAHKLNRQRKTRTFQQMSASDMIKKIAGESGLSPKAKSTSVVHEFFQQSNETDWDFAWRLALMHDFEVVVKDTTLEFRPANDGGEGTVALKYQDSMISFRPRMSGVQQPKTVNIRAWDPKSKKVVNGSASSGVTTSQAGVQRSKVSNDLGGGTTAVADRVATNGGEANALAKSTLDRMSDAFFEADGVAFGNPKIKAGGKVQVAGVG
jgi:phage protein D